MGKILTEPHRKPRAGKYIIVETEEGEGGGDSWAESMGSLSTCRPTWTLKILPFPFGGGSLL